MMEFNFESIHEKQNINKDFIEAHLTSDQIYQHYLGSIDFTKPIRSPFSVDRTPSFRFRVKNGELIWKDFSTDQGGDCFKLVEKMFSLGSFPEVLEKIAKDFNLVYKGNYKPSELVKKVTNFEDSIPSEIKIVPKQWEAHELAYWSKYNITPPTLELFNVKPVKEVWINEYIYYSYNKSNPCFRYTRDGGFKVYLPLSYKKEFKWRTNIRKDSIWGLEQLSYKTDTCFIVSSLKDIMCLYEIGFESVCMNSESCDIPDKLINYLKTKYKYVVIFLDADSTGLKFAKKVHKRVDIPYLYIPTEYNCKDQSDCCRDHGKIIIKELILELLQTYIYTL